MNPDLSEVWAKLEGMLHGLIVLLPNFGVAIIVFALFDVAGKGIKSLVMRLTERRRHRNLGVMLGRLIEVQASGEVDGPIERREESR